jgi:rhodanese-related sulfurtransferase
MDFVVSNWYLFVALGVIVGLLMMGPITQMFYGIKGITPAEAIQVVNREQGVIVDVCEPNEFREGRPPNSMNVPLSSLGQNLTRLEKYKSRPVVVSCRSGNRSVRAAIKLRRQGFEKVFSLSGGLLGWQRDNLPVEKG